MRTMLLRAVAVAVCLSSLVPLAPAAPQAIVAHRGASWDAPENTLAAFRTAWEQGADAIEGDFRLTRDGEVVCVHDADLQRTAGSPLVVAESTWDELRTLDVGAWKGVRFVGERIPRLRDVLATVPEGKVVFVEVKTGPELLPALVREFEASGLPASALRVIAFDAEVIASAKRLLPEVEAHWLIGPRRDPETGRWSHPLDEVLPVLERIGADGLDTSVPPEVVDVEFVTRLRAAGHAFHAWTVNDPRTAARLVWLGVDSITTDRPAHLRGFLPDARLEPSILYHASLDEVDVGLAAPAFDPPTWRARAGDAGMSWTPGVFDEAIAVRGGALDLPVRLPSRGTLAFWFRPARWFDHQTLFDGPGHPNAWEAWVDARARLWFRANAGGRKLGWALSPTADLDAWHHLAVTWDTEREDEAALQLFVDGRRVDQGAPLGDAWSERGPTISLGGANPGNTTADCAFDEVVLLDRVLDEGALRFLMLAAIPDRG